MSIPYYQKKNKVNNPILTEVMKERGFRRSPKKWKIYLPNGYTRVEKEIPAINIKKDYGDNDSSGNIVVMAVSGCDKIVSKSNLWILLNRKFGREESAKIIPESYILTYKSDMNRLKKDLKIKVSDENENKNGNETDVYILKKNLQRKEGLFLTKNKKEILESHEKGYKVAQKYIKNPLLVKGRKVNLRLYLLIVSHNGKNKAFLHKNGKCIYTAKPYDSNTLDFENNITSFGLDLGIYKDHPLNIDELFRHIQVFSDTELNSKQIENLIMTKVHNTLQKIMMAVDSELGKLENLNRNGVYCCQLFGLDFILTDECDIWQPYLLEFNKGPDMTAKTLRDGKYKKEVIDDTFNLLGLYSKEKNGFEMVYPNSSRLN